jgi:hypothetical protein
VPGAGGEPGTHRAIRVVRGCIVLGGLNPAPPAAHREAAGFPRRPGVVHASAATTCSTLTSALLQKIEFPVGLLDARVDLAELPGNVVSLRPQLGHRQGAHDLELRAQTARGELAKAKKPKQTKPSGATGTKPPLVD